MKREIEQAEILDLMKPTIWCDPPKPPTFDEWEALLNARTKAGNSCHERTDHAD